MDFHVLRYAICFCEIFMSYQLSFQNPDTWSLLLVDTIYLIN